MDHDVGHVLFAVGQLVLIVMNLFDIEEALNSKGHSFDLVMHAVFTMGVVFFFIGTLTALAGDGPTVDIVAGIGGVLGSFTLAIAVFLNGAHSGDAFATGSAEIKFKFRYSAT